MEMMRACNLTSWSTVVLKARRYVAPSNSSRFQQWRVLESPHLGDDHVMEQQTEHQS